MGYNNYLEPMAYIIRKKSTSKGIIDKFYETGHISYIKECISLV